MSGHNHHRVRLTCGGYVEIIHTNYIQTLLNATNTDCTTSAHRSTMYLFNLSDLGSQILFSLPALLFSKEFNCIRVCLV